MPHTGKLSVKSVKDCGANEEGGSNAELAVNDEYGRWQGAADTEQGKVVGRKPGRRFPKYGLEQTASHQTHDPCLKAINRRYQKLHFLASLLDAVLGTKLENKPLGDSSQSL